LTPAFERAFSCARRGPGAGVQSGSVRVRLIDNYDSFTYNLVQRIAELSDDLSRPIPVEVVRNDRITAEEAAGFGASHLIVSPGPCTPEESGVSREVIGALAGRVPVLGVCLGHQCIGAASGLSVERHGVIMHGKTSAVHHDGRGVFAGLPSPFTATRYHSLVVRADGEALDALSARDGVRWVCSAWSFEPQSGERVIMGLRRGGGEGEAAVEGVQFHPESFLTAWGPRLLANFLGLAWPAGVWRERALDPDPLERAPA